MKRLWIALVLLVLVAALCVSSQVYLYHQTTVLLSYLTDLEDSYRAGEMEQAQAWAGQLSAEFVQRTALLDCFVAHSDLADSRETAASLPAILDQDHREELLMEVARLREQLEHLRQIDRPTWRNVL